MAKLSLREKLRLREEKEEAKKEWEACFSRKMEDSLNEEGIKHYWDDDTSLEDALVLLTSAAINDAFDSIIDNIIGIAVVKHKEKKEKTKTPFEVFCIPDESKQGTFETIEAAREFIRERALASQFTVDDFKIVKVIE